MKAKTLKMRQNYCGGLHPADKYMKIPYIIINYNKQNPDTVEDDINKHKDLYNLLESKKLLFFTIPCPTPLTLRSDQDILSPYIISILWIHRVTS